MANAKHVEILLQGVEVWNAWRINNRGFSIDLTNANLSGTELSGADLSEANLRRADLRGADLSEANLSGIDLSKAKISEANLSWADLSGANLIEANLSETDLAIADLSHANLSEADLSEANLSQVNLNWANLNWADLSQANLYEARILSTNFSNVDLRTVQYLDFVVHDGPSSIGIDTLFLSQGKIPEVFLRGCGVPESFITYIPSLTNRPIEFYSCFISHSVEDIDFAHQLHDFLQGRGIRCWLAAHQLLPGHDIYEEIDRGIKLWDKVILCASQKALNSWWVDKEIERIFAKERQLQQKRGQAVKALIPLDLDGYLMEEWDGAKASDIKARLVADFRGWERDNKKMRQQLELVYKALRTDEGREKPPRPGL